MNANNTGAEYVFLQFGTPNIATETTEICLLQTKNLGVICCDIFVYI